MSKYQEALDKVNLIEFAILQEAVAKAEILDKLEEHDDIETLLKENEILKQALLKAQEQEKEITRLKEILINGFRDNNGVFHKQTYLAFIDDEWCVCDLKTDEWFLVKDVVDEQRNWDYRKGC